MSLTDLYIRDKQTGKIRRIGDNQHDQLTINDKGQLCYYNLQNGDGCRTGDDGGGYEFMPNQDVNGFNADPTSCSEIPNGSDTIRQAAIDAIDNVDWYHPGSNGKMFLGASDQGEAWFRANDIYDVIEGMPFAELVNTCDGCIHSGKIDKDYPCRVCIRREKDYYAPER